MADGTSTSTVVSFLIPDDFVSLVELYPVVFSYADGDVVWRIYEVNYADMASSSGLPDYKYSGTTSKKTVTVEDGKLSSLGDFGADMPSNLKAKGIGGLIWIQRLGNDVADTCADSVFLNRVILVYTAEQ